jgi:hypothetical protein
MKQHLQKFFFSLHRKHYTNIYGNIIGLSFFSIRLKIVENNKTKKKRRKQKANI